jgi:uncharacterized protein (TIGR03435 family)
MTEHEFANFLKDSLPSAEQMETAGSRILERLRQSGLEQRVQRDESLKAPSPGFRKLLLALVMATIAVLVVLAGVLRLPRSDRMAALQGALPDGPLVAKVARQKPSFAVVSVKPNSVGVSNRNSSIGAAGGRFVAINVTLRILMKYAYRSRERDLLDSQLMGGPAWVNTDRFNVEAKPEGESRPIPLEEMQQLVQALLQDRFQLKTHRETRELPVYDLVVVKSGKLRLSNDQSPVILGLGPLPFGGSNAPPRGAARLLVGSTGGVLTANAIGMEKLADSLQTQVDRPIIDKTALSGLYDISLRFTPETDPLLGGPGGIPTAADVGAPPLFSAIEEQLGLKLQPGTGTIEVIVIDTVRKPSEN